MDMIALNNGSSEPRPAVLAVMTSIGDLSKRGIDGACAVSDLVDRCRNPNHKIGPREMKMLTDLKLIEPNGRIHGTIKNVVLSAAKGSGFDIKLGSPLKQTSQPAIPSFEELVAVADDIVGIRLAIMSAIDNHGVTMEELGTFVRNTPGGKKGEALWREFTSRRDKPGAKQDYGFVDFIREVIAQAKN